jgi:hypothetical protein
MMDVTTGELTPLERAEFERFVAHGTPPGKVLVAGTFDEVTRLSRATRLGNKELEARTARRRQQKQSRRRNR